MNFALSPIGVKGEHLLWHLPPPHHHPRCRPPSLHLSLSDPVHGSVDLLFLTSSERWSSAARACEGLVEMKCMVKRGEKLEVDCSFDIRQWKKASEWLQRTDEIESKQCILKLFCAFFETHHDNLPYTWVFSKGILLKITQSTDPSLCHMYSGYRFRDG